MTCKFSGGVPLLRHRRSWLKRALTCIARACVNVNEKREAAIAEKKKKKEEEIGLLQR